MVEPRPALPRWRAAAIMIAAVVTVSLLPAGSTESGSLADLDPLLRAMSVRPWWGDPPRLALAGLDGQRHFLDPLRGHVVLLYFWTTW